MHDFCIIPDKCENFWSFVNTMPLTIEEKAIVNQCVLKKVIIDVNNNCWHIHLNTQAEVSKPLLNRVGLQLCENCGVSKVEFKQNIISLEEYFIGKWPELIKNITQNPTVKHLLSTAKRNFDGTKLTLELNGDLASEIIEAHDVIFSIKDFIKKELAVNLEIECLVSTDEVEITDDDLLTPEYIEATQPDAVKQATGIVKKKENNIIFGRNIKDNNIAINLIQEEARNVVVQGKVVSFDGRELKSGRFLLTVDIADNTDGISGKAFFDEKEKYDSILSSLSKNLIVKAKGTVQFDKYANELSMFFDSLIKIEEEQKRTDNATVKRVELHTHTHMSNMDAVVSVKNLITQAAKWGHPAIAITDHGVVQAFPEAYEVAAKANIKIIYGMEGYLFENDINKANHIVILAKNLIGLRNLYTLVSLSHLKYLHRTPRIPKKVLAEYREGLIFGSACEAGELIQAIIHGAKDEELEKIAEFYDYLEIQPIGNNSFLVREGIIPDDNGLQQINIKVSQIANKLNKPLIATCDVHFLNPEDEVYRRILMTGKGFADADNQPPLYLRTTEEMLAEFSYLGKELATAAVIDNPRKIAEDIETFKPIPDELYSPKIPGAENEIRAMSYNKAKALYGEELPVIVAERLTYELNSIINNGFAVLYLIAHKLVKKSLDDGYLVGSRGSVGSSFVATMTDITEVNPLPPHWRCGNCLFSEFVTDGSYGGGFDLPAKNCPHCETLMIKDGHDIPFAVFMGFHGDKVPDIDLNFSGDYQPIAHKYTEELFGKDNVFRAGTIATIADKTAYGYVKNYYNEKGIITRNAHINSLVNGCTGVKRTTGQHPGGIMVVPRDMDVHHFTPIQRPADDKNSSTITTHFDYHSISSRLVKLDILGHDDPTVIKMLEDLTGLKPQEIPLDDQATMSLFSNTDALGVSSQELGSNTGTFGIPEFGTKFVRQMLEDTMPKTFSELVRISGFSHGTDVWLNNAQDLIKAGTAKLSEAISARDDIMVYLIHKGVEPSLAFKTMESVRKGKGIKAEDVQKLKEKNVPNWYIESCQKIKYMFPKAHAVAYVMMAFRIAYCKVHFPLSFYAAYFTVRATEFDAHLIVKGPSVLRQQLKELEQKGNNLSAKEKGLQTVFELALEMFLRGFTFERVDLNKSSADKFIMQDKSLLPPLASLQGLGTSAALNIVQARGEKEFSSIEDLKVRARLSKTVVDILQEHGCLQGMTESDQMNLFA